MMASFTFKPRQRIFVRKTGGELDYISNIEYVAGNKIYISLPLYESSPLTARIGDTLTVRMPAETHCLEFTTRFLGTKMENIPMYILLCPESANRIQLRRDVRLDVLMDVMYSEMPEPRAEENYKKATALNISAGGMKLSVFGQIPQNTLILVKFSLPVKGSAQSFELKARVIRTVAVEAQGRRTAYHIGVFFQEINNRQKDIICQYIFQQMAGLKREGKI